MKIPLTNAVQDFNPNTTVILIIRIFFTSWRVKGFQLVYEIQQFTAWENRRIFIIAYFMRWMLNSSLRN